MGDVSFGKTYLALIWLYSNALMGKPGSLHYYIAPTNKQAKEVAWRHLKELTAGRALKVNESELYVEVINNTGDTSIIKLAGADNRDGLRGISLSSLVLDEFAYMASEVWSLVLRPACSDQRAPVLFISSPAGYNWAYELYQRGLEPQNHVWQSWMFTTADGGNVSEEEIEEAKKELSAKQFAQEFLASFEQLANRVYDEFDRHLHVQDFDLPEPDEHLHIGIDFNVDPMTASVGIKVGDELHIVDEFNLENSRTELLCEAIRYRYPNNPITVYPDPACKARGTNSTDTNLSILRESRWNFDVDVKSKHDKVVDRVNTVQRLLRSAEGTTRLYISSRCVNIIKCLEGQVYKNGVPDKSGGLDHMNDNLGYLCCGLFPIKQQFTPLDFTDSLFA